MIYLLGGAGYVGSAFARALAARGLPHRLVRRGDLDLHEPARLRDALRADRVRFLVNAAGFTGRPNVDACESRRNDCLLGNVVLPLRVAEACTDAGVPWGHVSSGCVFQGTRADGSGFTEDDAPNFSFSRPPCSFYSGAKALAEDKLAAYPDLYLWRIRIPFDHLDHPRNYLSKLLAYDRLLDARNSLTHLPEFVAAALAFAWLRPAPGIYHCTNPGAVTTREVCAALAATVAPDRTFRFFADETEFMRSAALAPRSSCVLDSSKLARAGLPLSPVRDALASALARWTGAHQPLPALCA